MKTVHLIDIVDFDTCDILVKNVEIVDFSVSGDFSRNFGFD